jgi:Transposase DDE domain
MVHLLRTWVSGYSLSIAYEPYTDNANDIKALLHLLERIDLNNAVVTIDAIGTYPHIAQQINQEGGQYILALKGNFRSFCACTSNCILRSERHYFAG